MVGCMKPKTRLTPHELRILAVAASVDPRTAQRWLYGEEVTSTCAARLLAAYRSLRDSGALPPEE